MKVLIVGMNPSARSPNKKLAKNSTLDRLNRWMDSCEIINFSFINTCDIIKDKVKIEDVDLLRLRGAADGYVKVVALGKFASLCLDKARVNHLEMPHPSPLNRLLNDKQYEANKIKQCKNYIRASHEHIR